MAPCGYSCYRGHMPTKIQRFRYDDDDWTDLGEQAPNGNKSAVIAQMIDWYLCKPGIMLPARPRETHLDQDRLRLDKAVRHFLDWYARKPGVDIPERPPKT